GGVGGRVGVGGQRPRRRSGGQAGGLGAEAGRGGGGGRHASGSLGGPSTWSAGMVRWTSAEPRRLVAARLYHQSARHCAACGAAPKRKSAPSRSRARSCRPVS